MRAEFVLAGWVFVVLLLAGCIRNPGEERTGGNETPSHVSAGGIGENDLVISSSSVQGMFDAIYLFHDGTFLHVNILPWEGQQCVEGIVPREQHDSFIEFVKSGSFLDTRIKQGHEMGLLCEGSYNVEARTDNKSNSLWLPCVSEYADSTEKAMAMMRDISTRLDSLVGNSSKETCRRGGYIKTYNMRMSCKKALEDMPQDIRPEYEVCTFSDLDANLGNSLENERAITYVGPINETIEPYHRKYYQIDGLCYFVFLYEFDGESFRDYDGE